MEAEEFFEGRTVGEKDLGGVCGLQEEFDVHSENYGKLSEDFNREGWS